MALGQIDFSIKFLARTDPLTKFLDWDDFAIRPKYAHDVWRRAYLARLCVREMKVFMG